MCQNQQPPQELESAPTDWQENFEMAVRRDMHEDEFVDPSAFVAPEDDSSPFTTIDSACFGGTHILTMDCCTSERKVSCASSTATPSTAISVSDSVSDLP